MSTDFQTQLERAVRFKKEKDFPRAWEIFVSLAQSRPKSAYFWSNFAHLALQMNRYQEARQYAEFSLSLNSNNLFCKAVYVETLCHFKDFETAIPLLQEILEEKSDTYLLRRLIKIFEKQTKLEDLRPVLEEVYPRYESDREFAALTAEYFHKIGDDDKSAAIYQRLVDQGDSSDYIYQRLIATKTSGKSREEKIRQLELITKMPSQENNIYLLGFLAGEYRKLNEDEKAEQLFRKITRLAPKNLFQKKQIGFFFAKKGDYPLAIELLSQCLLQDPDDLYVRNSLFAAYRKQDEKEQALELIRQILARFPEKKAYYGIKKRVEKW